MARTRTITLRVRAGFWVARYGKHHAAAPFRLARYGRGKGVRDMGKWDALEALRLAHPNLGDMPFTVCDR